MKNGQRQKIEFLKKLILATVYFLLFTVFVMLTARCYQEITMGTASKAWCALAFIGMLTATIIFLIAFISSWEDIFEEDD